VRDGTLAYEAFLAEFPAIQCQLRHWLTQGLLCPDDGTAETCRRLIALDAALWSFVTAPVSSPPTTPLSGPSAIPSFGVAPRMGRNLITAGCSSNAC
jgi:hypothetical protein